MHQAPSRGYRIARVLASITIVLTFAMLPGCGDGGQNEGMIQEEQAPEITEANNAMLNYSKAEGKTSQ